MKTATSNIEGRSYSTLALWLAALIGITLLPLPPTVVRSMASMLITAGVAGSGVYLVRYAEPDEFGPPAWRRTLAFTIASAALTILFVLSHDLGVGGAELNSSWPFAIGLMGTLTILMPILGRLRVPFAVAVLLGGTSAVAVGLLLGESAVELAGEFLVPGAFIGAAFAHVMRHVREVPALVGGDQRGSRSRGVPSLSRIPPR